MAITYPLATPTSIGIESIELRAVNSVAISQSPYTYKQQVVSHGGQKWEASVTIPSVHRDKAAQWKAMLVALKGACTLSGTAGDESASVAMTGTLKAGDYIQLGSASSARLHQVLNDQSGDGSIDIWPPLRSTYTSAIVTFDAPKGVFRLANNVTSWSINSASIYGISFEAVEAIT